MLSAKHSFSGSASNYDSFAKIQRIAAEDLSGEVSYLNLAPKNILDLGCGTGFVALKLAEKIPTAQVTGLDNTSEMLEVFQKKIEILQKTNCIARDGDIRKMPFEDEQFDLVVSNAVFHWIEDLKGAFTEVRRVMKKEAHLIVYLYAKRTFKEFIEDMQAVAKSFLSFPTCQAVQTALLSSGFRIENLESECQVEYFKNPSDLFCHLRKIGGRIKRNESSVEDKKNIRAMIEKYAKKYRSEKGYPVTWELLKIRAKSNQ